MRIKVGYKIYAGFIVMILLSLLQGWITHSRYQEVDRLAATTQQVRVPMSLASADLLKAIQTSLSALRGWMLLGQERFKQQRKQSWALVDQEMTTLQQLASDAHEDQVKQEIQAILEEFAVLRGLQDRIEGLSHTLDNTPATKKMQEQLKPLEAVVNQSISLMIFQENKRHMGSMDPAELKGSKQLIKSMSDYRGTFAMAMAELSSFLITGDARLPESFQNYWQKGEGAAAMIQRAELTSEQKTAFGTLMEVKGQILILAREIMAIRQSDRWNEAIWLLANRVVPVSEDLEGRLDRLSQDQNLRMMTEMATLHDQIKAGVTGTWLTLAAVLVLGLLAASLMTRMITSPLQRIGGVIRAMAGGELSQRIAVEPQGDEIQGIGQDVNIMADGLTGMIRTVITQSDSVESCVKNLEEVKDGITRDSDQMERIIQKMVQESGKMENAISHISRAIAQASDNIEVVFGNVYRLTDHIFANAKAVEQSSQNGATVAAAAEQMTSNLQNVNQQLQEVNRSVSLVANTVSDMNTSLAVVRELCSQADQESRQADQKAKETFAVMSRLSQAAQEIGKVVNVINTIADQTKMLALNAAIEAAGAGEAGQGFAVVAGEVKALATQTADATRMIAQQVTDIQECSRQASQASHTIADIIDHISRTNHDIVQAVEEQTHATHAIARSMKEVVKASSSATNSSQELEGAADEVAKATSKSATAISSIANSSSEMGVFIKDVTQKIATAQQHILSIEQSAKTTRDAFGARDIETAFEKIQFINTSVDKLVELSEVLNHTVQALCHSQDGLHV